MSICSRCKVETGDIRTIKISCGADMSELGIPFERDVIQVSTPGSGHWTENRDTLEVCKNCRAAFMNAMSHWFRLSEETEEMTQDEQMYCDPRLEPSFGTNCHGQKCGACGVCKDNKTTSRYEWNINHDCHVCGAKAGFTCSSNCTREFGTLRSPPSFFAIVWVDGGMYYSCHDEAEVSNRLTLCADVPYVRVLRPTEEYKYGHKI